MEKVTASILGEVLIGQNSLNSISDLLYLSRGQPFEERANFIFKIVGKINSSNNGFRPDLVEILAQCLLQIKLYSKRRI